MQLKKWKIISLFSLFQININTGKLYLNFQATEMQLVLPGIHFSQQQRWIGSFLILKQSIFKFYTYGTR